MKFIQRTSLALVSMLLALPVAADIPGAYKCTGVDPVEKSNYEIGLAIMKTGDTYSFKWKEEGVEYAGTGLANRSGTAAVAEFWNPKNPNKSGVIVYQIQPDGTLDGAWTYADGTTVGTENCKKQ